MMHWTSPYRDSQPHPYPRTWDLTVQGPPAPTSDIWLQRLETCSNMLTWGNTPNWCWHLVATEAVRLASGQYASYWNAFLFFMRSDRLTHLRLKRFPNNCLWTCIWIGLGQRNKSIRSLQWPSLAWLRSRKEGWSLVPPPPESATEN